MIKRSSGFTKSGPGRVHIEGPSKRRFPVAGNGGNWQGVEYVSYREHDRIKRMVRSELDEHGDPWTYNGARRKLIGDRAA